MKTKVSLFLSTYLLLAGCSSLGLSALNATSRLESGHAVTEDLAYGPEDWQKLDVHIPDEDDSVNERPVVVFFYGGGWNSGNKDQYYFAASAFTNLGYLVVIPDYIKYPQGKFPAFVQDGAKAVAWTKANVKAYGGNPSQVFIVGHSAGAHLGALLMADDDYLGEEGLTPADVLAFAGMAGPYNFTPKEKPYTDIFGPPRNFPNMKILNFIEGDEPPMLLLHGTDDKTVGILNKDSLVKVIEEKGGRYQDISYQGVSHVGILLSLHPTFIGDTNAAQDIDAFFQEYLITPQASDAIIAN